MAKTAARAQFREGIQIWPGFRGVAWYTARLLLGERGAFRRLARPLARSAYRGRGPVPRVVGNPRRSGSIPQTGPQSPGPCGLEVRPLSPSQCSAATAAAAWFGPDDGPPSAGAKAAVPALPCAETTQTPTVAVPALAREWAGFLGEARPPEVAA